MLLVTLLQQLKLNYLAQMNRAGIDALMEELDDLTAPLEAAGVRPASPRSAAGCHSSRLEAHQHGTAGR
jgi:hypothetical protein